MKITVTGGAGRLGSYVVRALCAAGHEVTATDLVYRKDLPVRVELHDLLDAMGCYRLVEGREVLVHLGNHPGPGRTPQKNYGENLTMNANIMEAAVQAGVTKIIYASSIQVIAGDRYRGDPLPASKLAYLPVDGASPTNPGNLYALAKQAAEAMLAYYARYHKIQAIAVRFPILVDPRWLEYYRRTGTDYDRLDEAFAYLEMEDSGNLVAALVKADLPGYRAYLPGSLGSLSKRPVKELVERYYPQVPLRKTIEEMENLVDNAALTRDTGWEPQYRLFEAAVQ